MSDGVAPLCYEYSERAENRMSSHNFAMHFAEPGDASLSRSELNSQTPESVPNDCTVALCTRFLFAKVSQVANARMPYALWTLEFKFRRRKCTVAGVAFQWPRSQLSKLCTHTFEPNVTITMLIGSVLRSNCVAPTRSWEKLLRQVAMSNWYLCMHKHMQFVQRHKLLLGRRTDCDVKQKWKLASHRISFECIFSNKFVFCHIFFRRLFLELASFHLQFFL